MAKTTAEPLILALDVGTLSVRAAAYDRQGKMITFATQEIDLNRINVTRVEQDPRQILAALQVVMNQVLAAPAVRQYGIGVAGLACQRSSVVAWDRTTGEALTPVLSWQDRRAAEYLHPLAAKGAAIKKRSGLFLSPHYGASKLRWLLANCPDLAPLHQVQKLVMGPLAAFILFHLLTEQPLIVDHVNASRTQLMDLQTREWSPELLADFGLNGDLLPRCRPTQSLFGVLQGSEIPLTAVNGDQNAAIHGAGYLEDDTLIVNIGTGAFVLLPTGANPIHHPSLLTSLASSKNGQATYLLEGTVNGAGAALQWAAVEWNEPDLLPQLDSWLKQITQPPVFINTIGGLGSPLWRGDLPPHFLSAGTVAEKTVAIIESIVFLININLEAMTNTGVRVKRIRISGGLSAFDGLCQLLANLSQRIVVRTDVSQSTARGIAWLAADLDHSWQESRSESDVGHFLPRSNRALQTRYRLFCAEVGWR